MTKPFDLSRVEATVKRLRRRLLEERCNRGCWIGELSSSALSTATAAFALERVNRAREDTGLFRDTELDQLCHLGLEWLVRNINEDGGWGDTTRSHSNLSTTTLCLAAFTGVRDHDNRYGDAVRKARSWIEKKIGPFSEERLVRAITDLYGEDRTFSVPILSMCALGGLIGTGSRAWKSIPNLPFELAVFPHRWYRFMGIPVVSYALPALIAIGRSQHHHHPTPNLLRRWFRDLCSDPALRRLRRIQPETGGFLEAVPLTAFVAMNLASCGYVESEVVDRCLHFLRESARSDGSWPIDTNLSTWVTTLSVNALSSDEASPSLTETDRRTLRDWLVEQQYRDVHPYTNASPGGWAWTDLPGGVPDADDTAGALLALGNLANPDSDILGCVEAGLVWLTNLQNRDGGVPTFCRGWGKLPFDRSGVDLTAHSLRAFVRWKNTVSPRLALILDRSIRHGIEFLRRSQRRDGSWLPLWFGNQDAPRYENPVYGTSRVLVALAELEAEGVEGLTSLQQRGMNWFVDSRNEDGGWGGASGVVSSLEETALAVEAVSRKDFLALRDGRKVWTDGVRHLLDRIEAGDLDRPNPIGFYFANLWYYDRLYPLIFALSALGKVRQRLAEDSNLLGS